MAASHAARHGTARAKRAAQAPLARAVGAALLVNDEALVREATADMLAELGYQVMPLASGDEALRLVEADLAPDLLVTNHLTPGMTGRTSRSGCGGYVRACRW